MNFSSGLIGGIVGDAMKEGPSGLVGGIVGDQIKKDPRGLIGGLAGGGMKGLVDTKERIIRDGRIFSRPRFGGPVHGPDNRRFTPDPNPYDVPPEPRGYGQGTVDDFLNRPRVDNIGDTNEVGLPKDMPMEDQIEILKKQSRRTTDFLGERYPFPRSGETHNFDLLYRPGVDKFEIRKPVFRPGVDSFEVEPMDFLNRTLEQNKEVMGPKTQVFPRFADPGDGVLKNPMMVAEVPGYGPMIPDSMIGDVTERVIPGYKERRDALRRKILGMLRGA